MRAILTSEFNRGFVDVQLLGVSRLRSTITLPRFDDPALGFSSHRP
jgi:hypothetical protein